MARIDRKEKTAFSCPSCQCERMLTYAQRWNIRVGKSPANCRPCLYGSKIRVNETKSVNRYHASSYIYSIGHLLKIYSQYSEDGRKKLSESRNHLVGNKSCNWKGGVTSERHKVTSSKSYSLLRLSILKRDLFACTICKSKKHLQVDHILEWCNYPSLRLDESNMRTLCKDCHKKTDNYGVRASKKSRQLCLFA